MPEAGTGFDRERARKLKELLRHELRCSAGLRSGKRGLVGLWVQDPAIAPDHLGAEIKRMLSDPATRTVKSERRSSSWSGELLGCRVFVKCYRMVTLADRIKYAVRISRARRYWAVARILQQAGLPSPRPLGYLEIKDGIQPLESYVITEWCDLPNGYQWLEKQRYESVRVRQRAAAVLWSELRRLYRAGIYHRDTKLTNLLIKESDGDLQILWTDLECVQLGIRPSRHRLIRNLVQLNGSLPQWVSSEERRAFLVQVCADFPVLSSPATVRQIHRWTEKRLARERRTGCGP